jgi:hypothetical protein
MRRLARIGKWLALAFAAVCLIAIAALALTQTRWGQERLRRVIESRGSAGLNGEVRLGSFRWSPRGSVAITDLVITQGGEPVITAPAVSVQYDTWAVLRRGLVFRTVTLDRPAIRLAERIDGWNVSKLLRARPRDDAPGPTITVGRVQVVDGSISIRPLQAPARELAAVNVDAAVSYASREFRSHVASASARDAGTGLVMRRLSVETAINGSDLSFRNIDLVTGASHVTGNFRWHRSLEQTDVEVDLVAKPLALAEAGLYVERLRDIPLSPSLRVRARGSTAKMTIDLSMASPAGDVSGHAAGGFEGEVGRFAGEVNVASLDLEPWFARPDLRSRISGQSSFALTWPDAGPAHASVDFLSRISEIALAGYAATGVRAKGTYRPEGVTVDASGTAYGSTVTATAAWDRGSGELSSRGTFAGLDMRRLPRRLSIPAMESRLAGDYDAVIRGRAWRVGVILDSAVVAGARVDAGAVAKLDTAAPGPAYSFRGSVAGIDLDRFKPLVALPAAVESLHGRLNAAIDFDARGTRLADASFTLALGLTDSVVCRGTWPCGADGAPAVTRLDRLDATVSLASRRLVADVTGDVRGLSGSALGVVHQSAPSGDGHVETHFAIADVTAPLSIEAVEGTARATFANASLFGFPVDKAIVDTAVGDGAARVNVLDVRGPSAAASARGTIALTGEGQSDLTFAVDIADLRAFQKLTEQPLEGSARVEGKARGPAGRLETSGKLVTNNLAIGPARALALKTGFTLTIPENDVKRATGQADLAGAYVEFGGRRIDEVTGTLRYDGASLDVDATVAEKGRTIRLAGALVPHPDHHEVHVRSLSLAAGGIEWQTPAGQEAVAQYAADRLAIGNFQLVRGDSRIRIEGTASASAGTASPLVVTVERVPVEDINRLLLGARKLTGLVDGTARISGALSDPTVDADVSITAGTIENIPFESLGGKVNLTGPALTVDVRLEAGPSGRLTAIGSIPVAARAREGAPAPPFDLRVHSPAIDLALFQPLTTHLDTIAGTGQLDVLVSGTPSAPRIEGLVGVQNGSFRVVPTGVVYRGLEAAMAVEGDRLTVQQLRVLDDDGHSAFVTGTLKVAALGRPGDFNLAVQGRDFHVVNNRFGELSVSPDLRVMGDLTAPLVSGTIRVDRGRLEVSDLFDRFGASGYKSAAPDPAKQVEDAVQAAAPTPGASYSVTLDLPENLILRGRDLRGARGPIGLGDINVTLGGALTVAKDTGGPTRLLGQLVVIRGQYSFQGRPFSIQRDSELRFAGDEMLNPELDVRAERQISGVVAEVQVTGSLRQPEVALSSEPPLDEGDILSLIAFNQTMNQLQTTERVSLAARAGVLAARAFATPISDSVARALDFDQFEIQPGDDVGGGASVTIGRQVNERLFVGFRHEFGSEDVSQVSFEYRLNQFLRVVTSFTEGAEESRRVPRVDRAAIDFIYVIRR